MPGRPPTPTTIKLIKGKPGHHPLPANEAQPELGLPKCPVYLKGDARKEWYRIGKQLVSYGLMTKIDETALAAYCNVYALWVRSGEEAKKFGLVVTSEQTTKTNPDGSVTHKIGKPIISPYLRVVREAHDQMVIMLREFGMTPAARSRVHAQQPQRENKLSRFLQSA